MPRQTLSMTKSEFDDLLDQYHGGKLADPYPFYQWLRENEPVYWDEPIQCWLITRYEDVSAGFRDLRLTSERVSITYRIDSR